MSAAVLAVLSAAIACAGAADEGVIARHAVEAATGGSLHDQTGSERSVRTARRAKHPPVVEGCTETPTPSVASGPSEVAAPAASSCSETLPLHATLSLQSP